MSRARYMPRIAIGVRVSSSAVKPRWQAAPYRQSQGRREYIHGRIQPSEALVAWGRRVNSGRIALAIVLATAAIYLGQALRAWL